MSVRKLLGGVMVVMLAVGFALPALGAQLKASDRPAKSGPLSYDGTSYNGPDCRNDQAAFGGEIIARYKTCSFFYRFDPDSETNSRRDYGALWLQSQVNPDNGWCASKVTTKLELLDRSARVQRATKRHSSPASSKRVVARLRVDAGGKATEAGKLRNGFKLYPKEFSSTYRKGSDTLRLFWNGATRRTVAFAGGIAISWPRSEGPPAISVRIEPVMQNRC